MSGWAAVARGLKPLVSRGRGNLTKLELSERGRALTAWCPDDEVFTLARELILDRIYERGGTVLYDGLKTVVDAGAHVGIFSLQASQWADRVISLEASRTNYNLLSLNVDRNDLGNVEPRHCALWSMSSDALGFADTHHSGGGSVVVDEGEMDSGDGPVGSVPATSLDDLIAEVGPVDLLKMDIEGAEYEVLGACTKLASISCIVGEMHLEHPRERSRLDGLMARLETAGLSPTLVTERELYSSEGIARLRANRAALRGKGLTKLFAWAYYAAPIDKPIRPAGATYELPILVARRMVGG